VSTQVLPEYFAAATRKLGVPAENAQRKVELFARFHLVPADLDLIIAGIDLHRLHGFSFWYALIVRSSVISNCSVLYTARGQHSESVHR
jgi:predicted nucleic acid-binding protein